MFQPSRHLMIFKLCLTEMKKITSIQYSLFLEPLVYIWVKVECLRHKLLNIFFQSSLDNFSLLCVINVKSIEVQGGTLWILFFSMAKRLKFISFISIY